VARRVRSSRARRRQRADRRLVEVPDPPHRLLRRLLRAVRHARRRPARARADPRRGLPQRLHAAARALTAMRPGSPFRGLERSRPATKVSLMRRVATLRALGRRAGSDTGFTVIELIVSMAILLVVVSLTGALVSMSNTESDVNNRFQTQAQARQALTKLTREIHCANQIQDG